VTAYEPVHSVRTLLGTAFTGAGIAHILEHQWFEGLVPEPLARWRKPISAITAVMQIVGGLSMFVPRLRGIARWTNLAMLVPTLPAAASQIRHPEILRQAGVPPQLAPIRVVVQALVAVLTWWATQPEETR
jgi:uncharacterized membrane protein